MEMSRGLLVLTALFIAGAVAQNDFNRDFGRERDRERERERDRERERERFFPGGNEIAAACRSKPADVFFILDSSSSIYILDYELQRRFVRQVVRRFDVAPLHTRVGALTYSDNYRLSFGLNEFNSHQDLHNAVNDQNIPYLTGLTNTADAIRYVRTNGQFRPEVTRVIVVITDGYSRQPTETNREADMARREGFYMFVIGVGQYTDEREWRSIANDPDRNFIYNITNYRALDNLYDTIPNRICELRPIIISRGGCHVREYADLIFVAGPGEADTAFGTVSNVVNALTTDSERLRLSLLLGSCKASEVPLSDPSLFCSNFGDPNPRQDSFSNLLKTMRADARDARGTRPQVNQVAVLFINQQTMDLDRFAILREARDAQYDGIEVFVVDLGVSTNNQFLNNIASRQPNVFATAGAVSIRDIESQLLGRVCRSMNERHRGLTPLPPV